MLIQQQLSPSCTGLSDLVVMMGTGGGGTEEMHGASLTWCTVNLIVGLAWILWLIGLLCNGRVVTDLYFILFLRIIRSNQDTKTIQTEAKV